ncbi:MAG: energy-coupling factor transporter ATPase [Oscillospiraceae bacterium]|nr:energy-coupling factor transporter ATPase [Oscillospiraceae bacterium]
MTYKLLYTLLCGKDDLLLPLLKTEQLTHTYSIDTPFEHIAICDVDFEVEKGEYLGIIGHTGSGKSTFIQHLNGLLKPTSGRVYFNGADIHESKLQTRNIRFKVGLVFQYPEYQLFENTVFDDIAFGPKNMGLSEGEVSERVIEAAGFALLDDALLKKSPFELSGGQKRRAAIAGVIAMRPEVLILDEPTAGLDPRGRAEIIGNIMNYKHAHDATIIMVTHSMEEIARNVDRIVIFEEGRIVMEGAPGSIFSDSERLLAMGLSAPKAALVAQRLHAMGLPIKRDIYTIPQLRQAINDLKGGGKGA